MAVPLTLQLIARTTGFQANLEKARKSFGSTTKRMLGDAQAFKKIGSELKTVGVRMTVGVSLPMLAAGASFIKSAGDFEQAFAGVRKTVSASEAEFAILRTGIRKMATEIPASAVAISAVAEAAGQLGIKTENILDFTRVMIDLGNTTNLTATEAATQMARFANITKLPQDEVSNLASVVVDLGNNLATTEQEILAMGLRMAAAADIIGFAESDTLALAGAMSSVGIEAEAGGTAMTKVMIKLASAIKTPGKELDKFAEISGMTTAAFVKSFDTDAALALTSFIEGLDRTSRSGGNVFAVLEDLGLQEIRLRRALLSAANAGDILRDSFIRGKKAFEENTALSIEATEKYKTFQSQASVLGNKLRDIGIVVGTELIPILLDFLNSTIVPLIEKVKGFAESFSKLDVETQRWIVGLVAGLAAGGPVIVALGFLVSAIETIAVAVAVVFFGPIGIIAAVVALGLWLVKVTGNWEEFESAAARTTKQLGANIKEHGFLVTAMASVINVASGFNVTFEESAEALKQLGLDIRDMAGEATDSVSTVLGLGDAFGKAGGDSEKALVGVRSGLTRTIQKVRRKTEVVVALSKNELSELIATENARLVMLNNAAGREVRLTSMKFDDLARATRNFAEKSTRQRKATATALGNIERRKAEKIIAIAQEQFKARVTLDKALVVVAEQSSNVIRKAINGQVTSSSDVWKDFFSSVVDILAQMAVQAITKAAIIGAQMAIATAGITLVIGLLASVFGGRKKKDTQVRDAVENFLKEVRRSLDSFEDQVLSTLQRVTRNTNRARTLSGLLERRLAVITKLQDLTPNTNKGGLFFRVLFDETTALFKELTNLGSNTANPRERFRDLIKEQILLLTKNSQETLDLINAEFDLKKANINEILNLLQRQKAFIKDINSSITDVAREFFTPQQLFAAQKSDISALRGALTTASGEERLTLLTDLKAALLASFETAKGIFAPSNQDEIQTLRQEQQALQAKTNQTLADQARQQAVANRIEALTIQDMQSEAQLVSWQGTVIQGLKQVRDVGATTFDRLIDLQLRELQISESSLVTEQGMRALLTGLANASALSVRLLGEIAKSPATTSAKTISDLSSALSVIFPANNPTLANILSSAQGLPGGLPQFAQGGVVNKPTLGIFGEAGPEAIVPLSKLGQGGNTIIVNATVNVRDAASLSSQAWEQILKENLGTAMERINRQGFRSALQPQVIT